VDLGLALLEPGEVLLDDVAGVSHGFVDAFDADGNLLHRVASPSATERPPGR